MSHTCPGGCGKLVPDHLLCCRNDWYWLPPKVRAAVWDTQALPVLDPERLGVLGAVVAFYIEKGRTPPPEWAAMAP